MKMIIGITDCGEKYPKYEEWIRASGKNIEVVRLSYDLDNFSDALRRDGFVLSGGHDVHPQFYAKHEYVELLDENNIDERRDEFELKVIEESQKRKKPVLGICRGLQIANVYFGGTLVPDILTHLKIDGHDKDEESDSLHPIEVTPSTLLHEAVRVEMGLVNSAHHQSADKTGTGLQVNATSEGGIIEGLELIDGERPLLMLVQWHPERIHNQENRFAGNVREYFLEEVKKWK